MENLPNELLFQISSYLNIRQLRNLSQTSKRFIYKFNYIWYQRLIQDFGSSKVDWKKAYLDYLNKLDDSQENWEKRYLCDFGNEINWKKDYIDRLNISDSKQRNWQELYKIQVNEEINWINRYNQILEKNMYDKFSYITFYNFDYNRTLRQNSLTKAYATEIVNIFITTPILLELLDFSYFNKTEKFYSGFYSLKTIIQHAFEYLLINHYSPDIAKFYNSVRWF